MAVAEFVAAAIAPFALGHQLAFGVTGVQQGTPVPRLGGMDACFKTAAALIRGDVGVAGLSALAKNGAGGEQRLKSDQGAFHGEGLVWGRSRL